MKVVFQQVPALREPRVAVQAATLDEQVAQTMRAVSRVVAATPLTLTVDAVPITIQLADITFVDVAGDYVTVHTTTKTYTVRQRLKVLAAQLVQPQFIRVSRSAIVNLDAVDHFKNVLTGNYVAILKQGDWVPVSRRYWQQVKERVLGK
ncbi:LytTR family DNA-binding domain-containing protein [Ligilactobacillus sp. LYQ139]|uniref:LytTR family DNA-binding domain-containing protein n=1 Tax=Ligilactobacillus sp. LYQ139 TaxID=3378800 RepID=UPI0038530E5C